MLVDDVYSKDKIADRFLTNFSATHEHHGFGRDANEDLEKDFLEK